MANPDNLGSELIRQDRPAGTLDLERITRRERWKVRAWATAAIVLWIVAAVYLFALLGFYAMIIHPVINEFFTGEYLNHEAAGAMKPRMMVIAKLLLAVLYWPALLSLAAVCTVLFTLASRRATLRQIQASLAEISVQLKAMGGTR